MAIGIMLCFSSIFLLRISSSLTITEVYTGPVGSGNSVVYKQERGDTGRCGDLTKPTLGGSGRERLDYMLCAWSMPLPQQAHCASSTCHL